MKFKLAILAFVMVLLTGCKDTVKPIAEQFIKDNNLDDRVTTVCYDWIDKKPCPKGTFQTDIDILFFIPSDSRFCFGTTNSKQVMPDGMTCYKRNIIK